VYIAVPTGASALHLQFGGMPPKHLTVIGDSISVGIGASRSYAVQLAQAWSVGLANLSRGGASAWRMLDGDTAVDGGKPWLDPAAIPSATSMVIIMLGTVEYLGAYPQTMYRSSLLRLVGVVRTRAPQAKVVLIHAYPLDLRKLNACRPGLISMDPPRTYAEYGSTMAAAAASAKASYVDLSAQGIEQHIGPDCAHLTDEGQAKLHVLVDSALRDW